MLPWLIGPLPVHHFRMTYAAVVGVVLAIDIRGLGECRGKRLLGTTVSTQRAEAQVGAPAVHAAVTILQSISTAMLR
jgi:hypothetical protein